MLTIFMPTRRTNASKTPATNPVRLTRTFVETGDERCPIAGIWSTLPGFDATTDEPELPRPVLRILPARRAIHRFFIHSFYTAV